MMNKSALIFIVFCMACATLVAGCNSDLDEGISNNGNDEQPIVNDQQNEQPEEEPEEAFEPVELQVYGSRYASKEGFMEIYGEPIQEKYPHLSFNVYENMWIADIVTSGSPIDIFYSDPIAYPRDLAAHALAYDMTDLIKKFDFDLNRLYPGPIAVMEDTFNMGITGLPLAMRNIVLHYNKDLFDLFGINYPTDGMTWDEVYELARTMTREHEGVQYRGMDFSTHAMDYNQMSLGWIDPETGRAAVNNTQWAELIKNYARFYEIPGNEVGVPNAEAVMDWNRFGVQGITAMEITSFVSAVSTDELFNMDYATTPEFPSKPGVGSQSPATYIGLTASTQHHEEAFRVIEFLLSDEFQTKQARNGSIPALLSAEVNNAFGENVPELEGKNLKAVIPSNPADPAPFSSLTGSTHASFWTPLLEIFTGQVDLNTGLRNIEESINSKIDELNASNK